MGLEIVWLVHSSLPIYRCYHNKADKSARYRKTPIFLGFYNLWTHCTRTKLENKKGVCKGYAIRKMLAVERGIGVRPYNSLDSRRRCQESESCKPNHNLFYRHVIFLEYVFCQGVLKVAG
jgi:hypothetical protein